MMRFPAGPLTWALLGLMAMAVPSAAQSFDHAGFDSVLARYVQDGRVDYAALKRGRASLDSYLDQLAAVTAEEFANWPSQEQIAYLINAYNAYVLETVIDRYPIQGSSFLNKLIAPGRFALPAASIRHIDGAFDGILHRVAGQEMTLDGIEHETLRAEYREPRIHFALVCAALSCPPLRDEAYRGDLLAEQLDDQARRFLNDPRLNRFEVTRKQVWLSKIFDWHGEDFLPFARESGYRGDERMNGVLNFVSRYLLDRVAEFLDGGDYQIRFLSYDWTLNDQAIAATGG
ncbi:MAG: hypothetical protein AMS25_15725 [Gemmatimonas sp. SM23_52]|nr:MAG: hypothetical protein AMS25_15725 [Gemmatimonas sp. SM23_52]